MPDQLERLSNSLLVLGLRTDSYVTQYDMTHHIWVIMDVDGIPRRMVGVKIACIHLYTDEALLQMVVDAVAEQEYRVRSI